MQGIKRIVQISTADIGGGAERVAMDLHRQFLRASAAGESDLEASVVVGFKRSLEKGVYEIPPDLATNPWQRLWLGVANRIPAATPARHVREKLAFFPRWLDDLRGRECFRFAASRDIRARLPHPPDILHAHNLHGRYFDLRALAAYSSAYPFLITAHDAWLLAGHCAHSFDCERWLRGCGDCPYPETYPAVRRDATDTNWRTKQEIFRRSRLYITAPSQWLLDKFAASPFAEHLKLCRPVPNGVDLDIYRPAGADRAALRRRLALPADAFIAIFAANGIRDNPWKDWRTLRRAIESLGTTSQSRSRSVDGREILLLALGENAPEQRVERIGRSEVRFLPFDANPRAVADWYAASDVYVHATRADTFPLVVLEALGCGLPVIATAVGGVPEQVEQDRTGFLWWKAWVGLSCVVAGRVRTFGSGISTGSPGVTAYGVVVVRLHSV